MPKSIIPLAVAASFLMAPWAHGQATTPSRQKFQDTTMTVHPYLGMWVTKDGHIRQELLPNGRYDEARGSRKSAYQGRYEVRGTKIDYWDDTGFTADGEFIDDVLHHGGMLFYRETDRRP
jgi:hypothetical protein